MTRGILGIEPAKFFDPLRYEAGEGKFHILERIEGQEGRHKRCLEDFEMIAALEYIEKGYVFFGPPAEDENGRVKSPPPIYRHVKRAGERLPKRPKETIRTETVKGPKLYRWQTFVRFLVEIEGKVFAWEGTSAVVLDAVGGKDRLYDLFDKLKAGHEGECPVIKCIGFKPIQNMNGTSQQPILEIVDWVEWPEGLPQETIGELRGDDADTDYPQEHVAPVNGGGAVVQAAASKPPRPRDERPPRPPAGISAVGHRTKPLSR
jgi:hypothetical protein